MRINILKRTPARQGRSLPRPGDDDGGAFRTSLLALNAAVEGACRGECGGGRECASGTAPVHAVRPIERNENNGV